MSNLLYKEEVYQIVGLCMDVYNHLGYGFLEVVYKDAMQIEFEENDIEHIREKEFPIFYKDRTLKRTFRTDFTVFKKIIVEVKANAEGIAEDAMAQTINYLKVSGSGLPFLLTSVKGD
jgi:GxxExxY protein